jgi:hypothetical protein
MAAKSGAKLSTAGQQVGRKATGKSVQSEAESPLTLSVPEAGWRYFRLSRNSSYAAAERGDIPTVKVGRLLRVPVRAMERKLDAADAAA